MKKDTETKAKLVAFLEGMSRPMTGREIADGMRRGLHRIDWALDELWRAGMVERKRSTLHYRCNLYALPGRSWEGAPVLTRVPVPPHIKGGIVMRDRAQEQKRSRFPDPRFPRDYREPLSEITKQKLWDWANREPVPGAYARSSASMEAGHDDSDAGNAAG